MIPNRLSSFIGVACTLALVCPAAAQDSQSYGYDRLYEFTDRMIDNQIWDKHLWKQLDPDTYARGTPRKNSEPDPLPALRTDLSMAGGGIDDFVNRAPPDQHNVMRRLALTSIAGVNEIASRAGLGRDNAAASAAFLMCQAWALALDQPCPDRAWIRTAKRVGAALVRSTSYSTASPRARRTLFEQQAITGSLFRLRKATPNRRRDEAVDKQWRAIAASQFEKTAGAAADNFAVGEEGLVPVQR